MKLNLRDLFWLLLVVGMGLALYLTRRNESRLQAENLRIDWKVRVLSNALRARGTTISDDGKVITLENVENIIEYSPTRLNIRNKDGSSSGIATFPEEKPYFFPPEPKSQP